MKVTRLDDALISVKPRYVKHILTGHKIVELRRKPVRLAEGTRLWIYSTVPDAEIKGVAIIDEIISNRPSQIWKDFGRHACISKDEFDQYFERCHLAIAIKFRDVVPLIPSFSLRALREEIPNFHPPQFFLKLREANPVLNILSRSFQASKT